MRTSYLAALRRTVRPAPSVDPTSWVIRADGSIHWASAG
jgi:hypothetical protein